VLDLGAGLPRLRSGLLRDALLGVPRGGVRDVVLALLRVACRLAGLVAQLLARPWRVIRFGLPGWWMWMEQAESDAACCMV
jgi:hypothetical protein